MGFNLRLRNVPPGAVLWKADFAEHSWDYDPIADSGFKNINQPWFYPSDPEDCTTCSVLVIDSKNKLLISAYNLGPIRDDWRYIYDCATKKLIECTFAGSIYQKVLRSNGQSVPIPSEIGLDEIWQMEITGRNDDIVPQQMGGEWWWRKDGNILRHEVSWASGLVQPGNYVVIYEAPLPFTMLGTYDLSFQLLMNEDCPELVDDYMGDLCTVVAEVPEPEEFAGKISRKELEYDHVRSNIPVY